MPCAGFVAWGSKLWASVRGPLCLLALCLAAVGCGSGEGRKRAIECHTDDECDATSLGVCDTVACENNRCELGTKPDGHRCDDADPLTGQDACTDGICAGVVKTCEDDLGPCLKAVHDPVSDECTVEPVEDGAPCDDADACTQVDSCQAGECVGGEAKTCEASDDCHVEGTCDPATGECSDEAAPDGAPCDDGEACTTGDACTDGACGGEAVVCDDGLACSVDSCDEKSGACAADMSHCSCVTDADCDDGNACNGTEVCGADDKLCRLGTPVVCGATGDPCLIGVCVPETGACEPEPVKDGTACDDGTACTTRDTCQAGQCTGAEPVVCTALSQCHVAGTCDKVTGACTNPEKAKGSACNDGNACTVTDSCLAGECVGSAQVTCAASDQCHDAGVCDTATGICSKPAKQNGVRCDDGSPCTGGDACQNGVCTAATQVTCSAQDSCHSAGTCDNKTGLCTNPAKPDGTSCSDGLTCTAPDVCTAGKCGGTKVVCNDGIACSVDTCSEKLGGCTSDKSACPCTTSADCNDGNSCNGAETCNLQTLQCQPGTPVDCAALNDACNVGTCSVATGKCVASPKANGTTCDDGDKCTGASSCQAGICQGTSPVTCVASDQCHDAGTCNSATGVCSNPPKANGSTCNDGNACTKTDSCQSGVCTGSSAVVCSALDQCHTAGSCDTSSGVCTNPAKKNGSTCDDGSLCTQTDTCQGGVCAGASPITCNASDQCHTAGVCDAKTGTCSSPAKKDGAACDDGTLCTQTDTCQLGVCTGAKPVNCTASDQCHTAGVCDGATGSCSNPAKKDGTACNDGSLCTQTDACQAGVCTGSKPVTCTASDQCHNAGTCDPMTGSCSNPNKTDGTLCNDGKTCTTTDKCTGGVCGGAAVTCDDKIACTVDSCVEPTGCSFDTSKCGCTTDAKCNDNNPCNGVETCDLSTLTCKNGTAVNCSGLDDACNVGSCDTMTGACSAKPRPDGTTCDDKDACTKVDACAAGKCVGSSLVTCTASDQCHGVGSCDSKTGVCSNPNKVDGSACNDNNKCTKTDTCQAGACTGANPVNCTASDQCHSAGTCDTSTGVCSNPVKTGSCDDGDKCTQTDTCQSGVCKGSNPVVCSASDDCHDIGACDSKTGACSNPAKLDGSLCDDGNKCTQSDSCLAGVCTGSKPVGCKALGQCYKVGVCDTQTGICSNPFANSGSKCDDSNACTSGEVCDGSGTCGGGSSVICPPPSNQCLTNTCNTTLGCVQNEQPSGTPCDDSDACTQLDQCGKGQCIGSDKRSNADGDWSDDPGGLKQSSNGPTSVDIFTDKAENANIVGIYPRDIAFNDKDGTPQQGLKALATQGVGIYWATYSVGGDVKKKPLNIGGSTFDVQGLPGNIGVADAAGHLDGSFTLVGLFNGKVELGLQGSTQPLGSVPTAVYVAHYKASGDIAWSAVFSPANDKVSIGIGAVAAHDDGSVVVIGGSTNGGVAFADVNGKPRVTTNVPGIWAARLDPQGNLKWAETVVHPGDTAAAAAVATHEDGSASLTGFFTGTAKLGPNGEVPISVSAAEARTGGDIWFQKLDVDGKIAWGGRVGGTGKDIPGDVERIKGGGMLLLANTSGGLPNVDDANKTQPLHATASAGLQTHVLGFDKAGAVLTDGLISNAESGGTRGFELHLDQGGLYGVAGVFASSTNFYGSVGLGNGPPATGVSHQIASLYNGPTTLFAARVDEGSKFGWAVQAGGDNSGMVTQAGWDIVMTAHPSHSLTLAGIFNNETYFGDQVPDLLQGDAKVGNAFVVHLNSEAEYDYCP